MEGLSALMGRIFGLCLLPASRAQPVVNRPYPPVAASLTAAAGEAGLSESSGKRSHSWHCLNSVCRDFPLWQRANEGPWGPSGAPLISDVAFMPVGRTSEKRFFSDAAKAAPADEDSGDGGNSRLCRMLTLRDLLEQEDTLSGLFESYNNR